MTNEEGRHRANKIRIEFSEGTNRVELMRRYKMSRNALGKILDGTSYSDPDYYYEPRQFNMDIARQLESENYSYSQIGICASNLPGHPFSAITARLYLDRNRKQRQKGKNND